VQIAIAFTIAPLLIFLSSFILTQFKTYNSHPPATPRFGLVMVTDADSRISSVDPTPRLPLSTLPPMEDRPFCTAAIISSLSVDVRVEEGTWSSWENIGAMAEEGV
jgi:hypothetical protein